MVVMLKINQALPINFSFALICIANTCLCGNSFDTYLCAFNKFRFQYVSSNH